MARDPEATRTRILDAAESEFATFGIAGARVDRIAENAPANKALIYKYFGSKDELFDTVFARTAVSFVDAAVFDGADLPGYAGRAFDLFRRYPNTLRLANWYQLERPEGANRAVQASNKDKLDKIAAAQEAGLVTTAYSPLELLTVVRGISMSWSLHTPELAALRQPSQSRRREIVTESVRRLIQP